MSISRWDPWGDIVSLREAMNNLLEESFVRPQQGPGRPGMASSLALDVKEAPDEYTVTASVPGVSPNDIDISILGDTLRIRGERKEQHEEKGEGGRWLLRERRFGTFERTVSLPTAVKADQANADFKDGVLTITLPKADVARPRSIPVRGTSTGGGGALQGGQPTEVEVHTQGQRQSGQQGMTSQQGQSGQGQSMQQGQGGQQGQSGQHGQSGQAGQSGQQGQSS